MFYCNIILSYCNMIINQLYAARGDRLRLALCGCSRAIVGAPAWHAASVPMCGAPAVVPAVLGRC